MLIASERDRAIGIAVAAGVLALLCWHAGSYFFLLDDSIVIRSASDHSVSAIITQPLFDFYRPAEHLWVKALFTLFGWTPIGYIATSILMHVLCAILVATLAWLLGVKETSLFAGVFFLVSPWATEPFLWVSAGFDLLATIGVLACLICGVLYVTARTSGDAATGNRWAMPVGMTGGATALLAKETGVVVPLLFATVLWVAVRRGALLKQRTLAYAGGLGVLTAAYLVARESLLPGLGSAYGSARTLLGRQVLGQQLEIFARALLWLPALHVDRVPVHDGVLVVQTAFVIAAVGLMAMAIVSNRRTALLCAGCLLVSIAPVMWAPLVADNTSGNRFLYLPGVWLSLWMADGSRHLPANVRRAFVTVILVVGVGSLWHQVRIWHAASALSRSTIEQLRRYDHTATPLFVRNLPGLFTDGPYVTNILAVKSFFGAGYPAIDGNTMTMAFDRGQPIFAFWMGSTRAPRPGDVDVRLSLPVWMGQSEPFGAIDAPRAGEALVQPFTLRGWVIDAGARTGTGVDTIHVYARRLPDMEDSATLIGVPEYGQPRREIAARFGQQFLNSGFRITVSGLRPGTYRLTVYGRRPLARQPDAGLSVDVQVR